MPIILDIYKVIKLYNIVRNNYLNIFVVHELDILVKNHGVYFYSIYLIYHLNNIVGIKLYLRLKICFMQSFHKLIICLMCNIQI